MVWQKRGKRRGSKKPSMAKAKRMITKQRKSKAKRNMDTWFFKARCEGTIVPQQGASVANYVYWATDLDPVNTNNYGLSHVNNAEFQLYKRLYDKYRINSVRVTVTPKANVMDAAQAQNDGEYNLSGSGVVHSVVDRDGKAVSNISAMARYPSYRKTSVLKKLVRSYAIKYPQGLWVDCQDPATFTMSKEYGLTGGITLYAENFIEDNYEIFNEPWAEVVVEYNIVFQGKTSAGLTFTKDESGKVLSVTVTDHDYGLCLPITDAKPRGTVSDLRIVDEITDAPITDAPNA